MVKNETGQIALVYYQPTPRIVSFPAKPKPKQYAFVVQHAVSLAWVDEGDVDRVLQIKNYCCNNQSKPAFRYASDMAVKVYETGSY